MARVHSAETNFVINCHNRYITKYRGSQVVTIDKPVMTIVPVKESFFNLLGMLMVSARLHSSYSFPEGPGYSTFLQITVNDSVRSETRMVYFVNPEDNCIVTGMTLLEFIHKFKLLLPLISLKR